MKYSHAWPRQTVPVTLIVLCFANAVVAQSEPITPSAQLDQLHAVLRSDAGRLQKIVACKKLGVIGTSESVPVLAELLKDPELSHAARIGLEAITDPAAGKALRDALPQLEGESLIGVLNSIGARRDPEAVSALKHLLKSEETQVACATAFALGRIATDDAIAALLDAISSAPPLVQTAIGQGSLIAAEQCRRDGRLETARNICEPIMGSQMPQHIRLGATRCALLSNQTIDPFRLTTLIRGESEADFAVAMIVVRKFPGDSVAQVIMTQLDQIPVARQVRLVTAFGERGDDSALPAVLSAMQSPNESVRIAAVSCLANFRQPSIFPKLLDVACNPTDVASNAASDALVLVADPAANTAILDRLDGVDVVTRIVLYQLIGRRHIADGVPALLQGADAQDSAERVAAIEALGETIPAGQLSVLTSRLTVRPSSPEQDAAVAALRASCVRLGDAETCAKEIVACLPKVTGDLHRRLYELLGLVGGPTALDAVAEAAQDPDPEMQNTITRVLGQWMTPDAAPLLLEIAQSDMREQYRIRALRGYIRILRQFDMTGKQRIEMCNKAMPLAKRAQERLLMLDALLRVPSRETLSLALTQLNTADVSHRAVEVVLLLSNILADRYPNTVIDAVEKVLATTQDATIKGFAQQLLTRAKQKKGS